MPTRVRSHAKINLGLFLGSLRADGFHGLVTAYQTLEIHDFVMVTGRRAGQTAIRITSNDARVPTDERNTAWKIVFLALEQIGVRADVEIHIDKRLPVQGGLGAGSGNAIAALVGLENELNLPFRDLFTRRMELAARIGSDVPLFLVGGTVLGVDRGQEVYPLPDIEPVWCVVAVPEIGVSTPQAFRDWDALCAAEGLTPAASADRLEMLSRAYANAFRGESSGGGQAAGSSGVFSCGEDLAGPQETIDGSGLVRTGITSWFENDFERAVFTQHPSLAEIKHLLAAPGTPAEALFASLSGSGSALFGLYLTREDADAAEGRVLRQFPGVKVQTTRTLPRATYWANMILRDSE
jgi:4-diphosphocytidyl-2-C-methyl-D-erythritol kinase